MNKKIILFSAFFLLFNVNSARAARSLTKSYDGFTWRAYLVACKYCAGPAHDTFYVNCSGNGAVTNYSLHPAVRGDIMEIRCKGGKAIVRIFNGNTNRDDYFAFCAWKRGLQRDPWFTPPYWRWGSFKCTPPPPPTLFVTLQAATDSSNWDDFLTGTTPLTGVDLRAVVSGTATGNIEYWFDYQENGNWQSVSSNVVHNVLDYSSAGKYYPKVRVRRAGITKEDSVEIAVGVAPILYIDSGLRVYNGSQVVAIAGEPGLPTFPLRISTEGGTIVGLPLMDPDPNDDDDSGVRIETSSGTKALIRYNP